MPTMKFKEKSHYDKYFSQPWLMDSLWETNRQGQANCFAFVPRIQTPRQESIQKE